MIFKLKSNGIKRRLLLLEAMGEGICNNVIIKLLETRGFSQYPGVYGTSSIHFYDPEYSNQPINQTKYRKYTNPNVVSIFSFLEVHLRLN